MTSVASARVASSPFSVCRARSAVVCASESVAGSMPRSVSQAVNSISRSFRWDPASVPDRSRGAGRFLSAVAAVAARILAASSAPMEHGEFSTGSQSVVIRSGSPAGAVNVRPAITSVSPGSTVVEAWTR